MLAGWLPPSPRLARERRPAEACRETALVSLAVETCDDQCRDPVA